MVVATHASLHPRGLAGTLKRVLTSDNTDRTLFDGRTRQKDIVRVSPLPVAPFLCAAACLAVNAFAQIPAFPGAEGFGAAATGGRGGQVVYVTNTNPDGPGSLQWALDQPGPRYVLFKVSGLIDARIHLRRGDVTIAGETSPGGITVRGFVTDETPFQDQALQAPAQFAENWILRHIRIRPGADGPSDDGLRLRYTRNAIVDHVSIGNATDEAVEISYANNISVQNCIIAETVGGHSFYGGMLVNYSNPRHGFELGRLSIHHNAFIRIEGRLPEVSRESLAAAGSTMDLEISSNLYWDPNFFIALGPDTGVVTSAGGSSFPVYFRLNAVNNMFRTRGLFPYAMWDDQILRSPLSAAGNVIHASGNAMNLYPGRGDFALFYCCNDYPLASPSNSALPATARAERHAFPSITYTTASALRERAVTQAGAFPRDPMDTRLLAPLAANRIDESLRNVNPANDALLPAYTGAAPQPPSDTDNDGMPDDWESARGLNPGAPDHNGTDLSGNDYTNLEVYLHHRAGELTGAAPPPPPPPSTPVPPLDLGRRAWLNLNFARSAHGFTAGFADLPASYDAVIYDLESGWNPRPAQMGGARALRIQGHNRSDDLFMFWKRQVTGLQPNTTYRVRMSVRFVSSYRRGSIGIGGSPAESVFVKMGASPAEPLVAADREGMLSLNLDKGNQAQSGIDAAKVGDVSLPARGAAAYGYVQRNNHAARQTVVTDSSGSLWLVFGTDSGFEGLTELWYTHLTAAFARQ
jgi:pectate lyase